MRTAAAYLSKLKAEALGRTFKVQDANHRAFTSTLYRGAAGCGPVDYTQIEYRELCGCSYLGPSRDKFGIQLEPPRPTGRAILDGGTPESGVLSGGFSDTVYAPNHYSGGSPSGSGPTILNGNSQRQQLNGGTVDGSSSAIFDGGNI